MGVATGIAIGTAIAGAYAAHKASQSASEATEAQTTAGDKALAVQKEMYDKARQDNDPYLVAGRAALGRLHDLSQAPRPLFDPTQPGGSRTFRGGAGFVDSTGQDRNMATSLGGIRGPVAGQLGAPGTQGLGVQGFSTSDAPPPPQSPSQPAPPTASGDRPWWLPPGIARPPGLPGAPGGPGGPIGPGLPNLPNLPGTASLGQPSGAQPQGPPGTVLMEAPTGERRPVPQNMVQQFIQRGGKVVQ